MRTTGGAENQMIIRRVGSEQKKGNAATYLETM